MTRLPDCSSSAHPVTFPLFGGTGDSGDLRPTDPVYSSSIRLHRTNLHSAPPTSRRLRTCSRAPTSPGHSSPPRCSAEQLRLRIPAQHPYDPVTFRHRQMQVPIQRFLSRSIPSHQQDRAAQAPARHPVGTRDSNLRTARRPRQNHKPLCPRSHGPGGCFLFVHFIPGGIFNRLSLPYPRAGGTPPGKSISSGIRSRAASGRR